MPTFDTGGPDPIRQTFFINIAYRQLAVFSSDLEDPFKDWSKEAFEAGFTWRLESCSFSTDEGGLHRVDVIVEDAFPELAPDALRSIEVTLEISAKGELEVAPIAESRVLSLRPGRYRIRSEYVQATRGEPPRFFLAFLPVVRLIC